MKFIYFDLGNVLLGFSHQRSCESLASFLGTSAEQVRQALFVEGWQTEYETGLITTYDLTTRFNERFQTRVTASTIARAASDMFWPMPEVLEFLPHLHARGHRLGILSNTCEAHWEWVARGLLRPYLMYFYQIILSFEHRSMKPASAIYDVATHHAQCDPSEILFVDDRPENVTGARAAGLQAYLYEGPQQLREIFVKHSIL